MRARSVRPEFWKHEDLADLSLEVRYFYIGLWCLADSVGILEDRAKRIAAELFPYDRNVTATMVEAWLDNLRDNGFINRYTADGQALIWIPKFRKHQYWAMAKDERNRKTKYRLPVGITEVDAYNHYQDDQKSTGSSTGCRTQRGKEEEEVTEREEESGKRARLTFVASLPSVQLELRNGLDLRAEWWLKSKEFSDEEVRSICERAVASKEESITPYIFEKHSKPFLIAKIKRREEAERNRVATERIEAVKRHDAEAEAAGKNADAQLRAFFTWLDDPSNLDATPIKVAAESDLDLRMTIDVARRASPGAGAIALYQLKKKCPQAAPFAGKGVRQ